MLQRCAGSSCAHVQPAAIGTPYIIWSSRNSFLRHFKWRKPCSQRTGQTRLAIQARSALFSFVSHPAGTNASPGHVLHATPPMPYPFQHVACARSPPLRVVWRHQSQLLAFAGLLCSVSCKRHSSASFVKKTNTYFRFFSSSSNTISFTKILIRSSKEGTS